MFTNRCNCYVVVLVANNKFSNNFKSPHSRKSQNSFGSSSSSSGSNSFFILDNNSLKLAIYITRSDNNLH